MKLPTKIFFALTGAAALGAFSTRGDAATENVVTPVALTGQNLEVLVGAGFSLVEGSFDYIYVRRWDNATTSASILIDVPVYAPTDATFAELRDATDIRLERRGEEYRPISGEFVAHDRWTPIPLIPSGSRIFVFRFTVPRSAVNLRFTVNVSYTLAHVGPPGEEVCAIIPFLPSSERLREDLKLKAENYQLTFNAATGVRLRLVSANPEKVSLAEDKIVLHARNRETIAIAADPTAGP